MIPWEEGMVSYHDQNQGSQPQIDGHYANKHQTLRAQIHSWQNFHQCYLVYSLSFSTHEKNQISWKFTFSSSHHETRERQTSVPIARNINLLTSISYDSSQSTKKKHATTPRRNMADVFHVFQIHWMGVLCQTFGICWRYSVVISPYSR